MSFEQAPIDPGDIERTKQQIRSLVGEIAQLSKQEVAPEEFYGQFLPRVVSALAAAGGAVWTLNPEGQLALQYQINIQETQLRDNQDNQAQHSRLLYKALSGSEGMLVPPYSGPGDLEQAGEDTPAANPTEFLLILGLLKTDLETIGLVEIFQRAEAGPSTQKGYLRFLMQMCELAGDFLKSHQLRHFSDRQTLWTQLEDFTRTVHASLDPRATAYTIANEGRRLVDCDRVSVAILHGKKCKIEAVSGQDVFDKRSNTVRLLGRLATAVVASGDAVWYTGDTHDLPPQVEDAVQEYVDEAHSKTVAVLPLQRPAPLEEDDPKKRETPEPPIGALIVEQIEDSRVSPSLVQRADVVCLHSSAALANALEHQNLFLMPVWRALGKTRWVLEARTLPKTLGIVGALLLLVLFLLVYPARFTLEAKGTLEPVRRQDVFAAVDGMVKELNVAHGDKVKKDQLLIKLRSTDVEVAINEVQGQRLATIEQLAAVQRQLLAENKSLHPEDRNRLAGQQAELKQKQISLEAQLVIQKEKELHLDVKSPIGGEVVTWDLHNRLPIDRPVQRGQVLLRVADPAGDWQLEVHMPENHMGHVTSYQQTLYQQAREKLRGLLREAERAKLGEAATQEDVDKAVEDELAQVHDEGLRDKLAAVFLERLHAGIEPILKDATDEKLRAKLGEVLKEKTYEQARETLDTLLKELQETPKPAEPTAPQPTQESGDSQKAEQPQPPSPVPQESPKPDQVPPPTLPPPSPESPKQDQPQPASPVPQESPKPDQVPPPTLPPPSLESPKQDQPQPQESPKPDQVPTTTLPPLPLESPKQDQPQPAPPKATEPPQADQPQPEAKNSPESPQAAEPPKAQETINAGLLARLQALPREELPDDRLDVTYILATEPGTRHEGRVIEIHRSAEVHGDEGNTVLIKVELDKEEMEQLRKQQKLRPGAAVTANVYCGRRPLGYVLLHDLISFIQSRILFRFF